MGNAEPSPTLRRSLAAGLMPTPGIDIHVLGKRVSIEGLLNLFRGCSALGQESLELGSQLGQDQLGCPGAWNRDGLLCQGLDDGLDEALVHAWRKRFGHLRPKPRQR